MPSRTAFSPRGWEHSALQSHSCRGLLGVEVVRPPLRLITGADVQPEAMPVRLVLVQSVLAGALVRRAARLAHEHQRFAIRTITASPERRVVGDHAAGVKAKLTVDLLVCL